MLGDGLLTSFILLFLAVRDVGGSGCKIVVGSLYLVFSQMQKCGYKWMRLPRWLKPARNDMKNTNQFAMTWERNMDDRIWDCCFTINRFSVFFNNANIF